MQGVCANDGGGRPGEEVGGMLGREEEGGPWSLQGVLREEEGGILSREEDEMANTKARERREIRTSSARLTLEV